MSFTHQITRLFLPLIILLSTFLLSACATQIVSPAGTKTTILLIRHADRNVGQSDLNDKGKARALALLDALSDLQIDAIYSPDKKRNLDTVRPLSKQRGLSIHVIETSGVAKKIITQSAGKTALWVGNTSNLDFIFNRLGGEGKGPNIYGDLYILTISDKKLETVDKKRFGGRGSL